MIFHFKDKAFPPEAGPKAIRLQELSKAGFAVPSGFAVTNPLLEDPDDIQGALDSLHGDFFAVRSSYKSEDTEEHSFAGIFESEINIPKSGIERAVLYVVNSVESERAEQYAHAAGIELEKKNMSVIVQEMIEADRFGVCFTKSPMNEEEMLVSIDERADGITDGSSSGNTFSIQRNGQQEDEERERLRNTFLEIETFFRAPQDIEFALSEEKLILLQTRPITT